MPAGILLLIMVAALIYFGAAQRVLYRMNITDSQALLVIGLMIGSSFIQIPIFQGQTEISINAGGALVPLGFVIYLFIKADSMRERLRGLVAALLTVGIVYGLSQLIEFNRSRISIIDPIWLFGIVAGLTGYLVGRSHRSAFIAGTLGIIITDLMYIIRSYTLRLSTVVAIGGAGIFDTVIIAGTVAVGLVELARESHEERLQENLEETD